MDEANYSLLEEADLILRFAVCLWWFDLYLLFHVSFEVRHVHVELAGLLA